ncbi:MAG: phospho-N-acetylmuramoyl-pentapeptide-transferase [Clostridia bacterium]|nr:phospho-N-acetylmuramoyl-pentapeptide-transferase [Clostridia bacterium]
MIKVYISAALVAFGLSLLFCLAIIPVLRKLKAGQNILSYVKEHKNKSGTPTMGGIAFIAAAVFSAAIFSRGIDKSLLICFAVGLSYMSVGLLDDFLKMRRKENLGLRAWQKFTFQSVVAVFCGIYCYRAGLTVLHIPFRIRSIQIGWFVIPLSVFLFLATVNAVNLTDGLDGLAASTCIPFFACLGIVVYMQAMQEGMALVSFCLVGALIAYMLFNTSPASVFMGDTGSLALGGFAAAIAVFTGNGLYLALLGACFVLSVISVMIQVVYYKVTHGKRVFLMSPIHHHFQQKGYSESKISYAYFTVTLVIGIICILAAL